jgi:hypothetical protein
LFWPKVENYNEPLCVLKNWLKFGCTRRIAPRTEKVAEGRGSEFDASAALILDFLATGF